MTPEQFRAMPAGAEMDAMVAREVMGWTQADYRGLWFPSSDIAAAWQVVEKLRSNDPDAVVQVDVVVFRHAAGNPDYRASCSIRHRIYDDGGWADTEGKFVVDADAPTAPLAICRASLLATLALPPGAGSKDAR